MPCSARLVSVAIGLLAAALPGCASKSTPASMASAAGGSSSSPGSTGGSAGTATLANAGMPSLMIDVDASFPTAGAAPVMLTDVTATEVGGYKLGGEIMPGTPNPTTSVDSNDGCGVLVGVVRDFKITDPGSHPDFEKFTGSGVTKGLVSPELDADHKPIYASQCEGTPNAAACPFGQQTTGRTNFDQWYRDTPEVNRTYLLYFQMAPVGNVVSFQSDNFVPLDGVGWNDSTIAPLRDEGDGKPHNYGFTTELHVKFKYAGGESFTFKGDDDVWAFINGHLAIDLGGLHNAATDTIALDARATELGLEKGKVYGLDLFHAERHSTGSHFRIDSTLALTDCGSIPIVR